MRLGLGLPMVAALAACDADPPQREPAAAPSAARVMSLAELRLRGATLPSEQRRVVAELRADAPLVEHVLDGVQDPAAADFERCADLATQLQLDEAAVPLLQVALDPGAPHRATALAAAARLGDVPIAPLLQLVDAADPVLQRAALAGLAGRDGLPFAPILRALRSADPRVAGAAAAALPMPTDADERRALETLELDSADIDAALATVERLALRPLPTSVLTAWQLRLQQFPPALQAAVLAAGRVHGVVAEPAALRALAEGDGPEQLRCEALRTLVAVGDAPTDWLRALAGDAPRSLRLVCGVALLRADEPTGAHLLFELAYGIEPTTHVPGSVAAGGEDEDAPAAAADDGSADVLPAAPAGESMGTDEPAESEGESKSENEDADDGLGEAESVEPALPDPSADPPAAASPAAVGDGYSFGLDPVAMAARQVLAGAARIPLHGGVAAFQQWLQQPVVADRGALALRQPTSVFFAPAAR